MRKIPVLFAAVVAAVLSFGVGAVARAADGAPAPAAAAEAEKPAEAAKTPEAAPAAEAPKAPEAPTAGEAPKAGDAAAKAPVTIPPTAPVAMVNGKPIVRAEYDRAVNAYMQQFRQMSGSMHGKVDDPNDSMKNEVLEQLVDRELLYQESLKFPADDLAAKADEEYKGIQGRFPTPEAFQEALTAQSLSEADLKDLVGRQMSVRHYVESQIAPKAKVSDEAIQKFYDDNKDRFVEPEQVKASHLLILLPEGAKPEDEAYKKAKAKAEELQKKAAGGEDFAQLCKDNSEDPGSKDQGGELGFFSKDRMVEPFATAAFALKVEQISDVVETRFGFHIIKLLERKDPVAHPFADVKEDIANYLNGQALDKAVQDKVVELKAVAKVEVMTPHM